MKLKTGLIASIFFASLIILTGIVEFLVLGDRWYVTVLAILMAITFFWGLYLIFLSNSLKRKVIIVLGLMLEVWFAKMAVVSVFWYFNGFAP